MIRGYWISQVVGTLAKLAIADQLAAGPRSVDDLASRIGCDPEATARLLRAASALGLVSKTQEDRFVLTDLGELLADIPGSLRDSAIALGLEPAARLRKIYLPLASRTILAGIKTSAVINIGTATLAALIGAGGLGEPILSGLNLNDNATILEGAIPAALLALLVQGLFDLLDRFLIPRGLRL